LSAFPKVTYVGFTATPFANVLVDATEDQDLYPKDFIAVLEEPPGYCGARKMFGLGMSSSALSPEESHDPQLKLIRELDDADLASLDEVEAGTGSSELLTEAILTFILSCCARLHRDLDDHFSMLIHPSHEKYVHEAFRSIVDEELQTIRQACLNPKSFKPILDQARRIWETNFIPTSRSAGITDLPDFDTIWKFAKGIVSEINILVLNSDSNDVLNYKTSVRQRYIVIGGNRLSRGLTLEGLAVSIFLRNSDKYDTLLQMGRWFGYRNGYLDLTRLYVSGEMADAFADLARVEDELRADLQQYAAQKDPPTPLEIMPKIRAHESLSVTSYLKLGAGQRVNISLQGKRVETVSLPLKKPSALKSNQTATSAWLSTLGRPVGGSSTEDGFTWTDVPHTKIVEFINSYTFSEGARTTNRTFLIDYILKQVGYKELRMWDVIVPSGSRNRDVYPLAPGVAINKVQRSKLKTKKDTNSIRVVASPSDITGWRETFKRDPKDQDRGALFIYVIDKQSAGRDGQNPLFGQGADAIDVIGLTFVFPTSVSNATVEYVTQEAP
jgi:hypothetical protein